MKRSLPILLGALAMGCVLSAPVLAQGTAQTMPDQVDMQSISTGWRASKIIGSTVTNEANEKIGTVDDLIVTADQKVPVAVLSVGGFLGVGNKLVLVPYTRLSIVNKQLVVAGATAESLKSLPAYTYAKD